jgi:hypothetical protein
LVLGGGGGDRFLGGIGGTLRAAMWSMFLMQRLAILMGFVKPEPIQPLADILTATAFSAPLGSRSVMSIDDADVRSCATR